MKFKPTGIITPMGITSFYSHRPFQDNNKMKRFFYNCISWFTFKTLYLIVELVMLQQTCFLHKFERRFTFPSIWDFLRDLHSICIISPGGFSILQKTWGCQNENTARLQKFLLSLVASFLFWMFCSSVLVVNSCHLSILYAQNSFLDA